MIIYRDIEVGDMIVTLELQSHFEPAISVNGAIDVKGTSICIQNVGNRHAELDNRWTFPVGSTREWGSQTDLNLFHLKHKLKFIGDPLPNSCHDSARIEIMIITARPVCCTPCKNIINAA